MWRHAAKFISVFELFTKSSYFWRALEDERCGMWFKEHAGLFLPLGLLPPLQSLCHHVGDDVFLYYRSCLACKTVVTDCLQSGESREVLFWDEVFADVFEPLRANQSPAVTQTDLRRMSSPAETMNECTAWPFSLQLQQQRGALNGPLPW